MSNLPSQLVGIIITTNVMNILITFAAVGGGDHSEFKEIEAMATDEDHVFRIRDQYAVSRERAKILEKIGLRKFIINIQVCELRSQNKWIWFN